MISVFTSSILYSKSVYCIFINKVGLYFLENFRSLIHPVLKTVVGFPLETIKLTEFVII